MTSPSPPIIELENVSVSFNGTGAVLDRVSLRIGRGEFVYLIGPTGAGKSTLLRLLYCDLAPVSGIVRVEGRRLCDLRRCDVPKLRRRMGVVFQDFGLLPDRNVYENVAFALRVLGVGNRHIRKAVPEALELVGLLQRPDAYPRELSGGEQQRVAIARALVNNPPLLLADEPTGNLDPDTSLGVAEVLEAANRMGTTVIVATHDRYMVNSYMHRVVEIARGSVVRDENPGQYDAFPRDGE